MPPKTKKEGDIKRDQAKINAELMAIRGDFEVTYEEEKGCTVTEIETTFKPDPRPDLYVSVFDDPEKIKKEKEKEKRKRRKKSPSVKKGPEVVKEGPLVLDKGVRAPTVKSTPKSVIPKVPKTKATLITFSIGSKKGHPFEAVIKGDKAIVADGKPGKALNLKWGTSYILKFIGREGSGHNIILTNEPMGGKSAKLFPGSEVVACGKEVMINIRQSPAIIYYQDRDVEFMGGMIQFTK